MKRFMYGFSVFVWLMMLVALDPNVIAAQTTQIDQNPANALVIASGTTHKGNVATFEQPIVIDGVVEGDVTSVTGSIIVRGSVEGDVVSLFGNVSFDQQAVAEGHVMAATGLVAVPDNAAPTKGAVFVGNLSDRGAASIFPVAGNQALTMLARLLIAFALAMLATVIAVLLSMIWTRSIGSGAWIIQRVPRQAFAVGVTWSVLAFAVLTIIALGLIFTLVGLAFVPVLFLIAQVPSLIGLAVVGMALGQRFGRHGIAGVAFGSFVVVVPCIVLAMFNLPSAFALFYLLTSIGIGGMALLRATVLHRNSPEYELS